MDKIRLYVWIALAGVVYYLYINWQIDYPPPPPTPVAVTSSSAPPTDSLPALPNSSAPASAPAPVTSKTDAAVEANSTTVATPSTPAAIIHVVTDTFDVDISSVGGELIRADLIKYPQSKKNPEPVRLFDPTPQTYFAARSGLRTADDRAAPTHQVTFVSDSQQYKLADGQDALAVKLTWTDGQGINVTKTYTFTRGSYAIALDYDVHNESAAPWSAASYVQMVRRQPILETSMLRPETYSHMGPAAFDGKAYHKLKLTSDDAKNYKGSYSGAWLAAMQHHFVAAAVPPVGQAYDYKLTVDSPHSFSFSYSGPVQTVAAGGEGKFHETIFAGPKLHAQLQAVGSNLDRTVDYGWLTIIAEPLFLLLSTVHKFVGNWGWAIILVTIAIKALFYKLTKTSGTNMAKMRDIAPRMKALQERYKDDREQLGRATMELYKREKVNPLAGCLPMLVQMPVWMAFYWVLLNGVEMRQAPFLGYLHDLSSPDPYFILPVFLGIVNFVQFKLNPQPTDPTQAKVMMLMPLFMTGMMVMFPAGLALYWVTNTLLSIAQQWHINRVVAENSAKRKE